MKKEYIFAGFGGQGMLLIGKFLAMACMLDGKHVSWLPSYGPEMRGGTANCSVIVSDDPVASPLVDMADCVVAMNRPSLDKFESHVKPGGVLVINSSIIDRKAERDDIQVVYCDANGIAESVGNPKGANVAILGALMEKAPVVSNEILGEAIRIELGEKKAKFLEGNMKALEAGEAAARGSTVPNIKKNRFIRIGSFFARVRARCARLYYCLSLDLKHMATSRPKKMAAQIPAAPASKPPVNAPSTPFSATASRTPFASRLPKPVSGTVAPAPAHLANGP